MSTETALDNVDSVFDDPSADHIIRSSDGVELRIYRGILATASPVFRDMLSIGDVSSGGATIADVAGETKDGLPVCSVSEESATLRLLLRLSYPLEDTTFPRTLDETMPALAAAVKYEMEGSRAMARLKKRIISFARAAPLRVYGFAVSHGLEDVARQAARKALYHDMYDLADMEPPELVNVPGATFQRLVQFYKKCRAACVEVCGGSKNKFPWMPVGTPSQRAGPGSPVHWNDQSWPVNCHSCPGAQYVEFGATGVRRRSNGSSVPGWWMTFIQNAQVVLMQNPVGEVLYATNLLEASYKQIGQRCITCGGVDNLRKTEAFIKFMAEEVDKRTLEISLQTDFC